jgi:hypothetical protein
MYTSIWASESGTSDSCPQRSSCSAPAITAYGLTVAYGRIKGLPERLGELWRRVARPTHVTGEMAATMVAAQMSASGEVDSNYRFITGTG